MKAKNARLVLANHIWAVEVCGRCDVPVVDALHSRHYDEYERGESNETWEPIWRPLTPSDCNAVREVVLRRGAGPVINWHMPDVGPLVLARWHDGYWFSFL